MKRHRYESNNVEGMRFFLLRTSSGEILFHGWSLEDKYEHIIRCEKSIINSKEYKIVRSCFQFGNKNQRIQAENIRAKTLKDAWKVFYRMIRTQKTKPALPV